MQIDTGYLPARNQQHSYAAGGKSTGKADRGGSSFDKGLTQVKGRVYDECGWALSVGPCHC